MPNSATIYKILNPFVHSQINRKIRNFHSFEAGWSFGEGIPFDENIIELAIALNSLAAEYGMRDTDAFPGLDGEIMLTIYFDPYYLEFTIESDQHITFVREVNDDEVVYEEDLTFEQAMKKITEFVEELWWVSGLSIFGGITTGERAGSPVLHSRTQEEETGVYPFYATSVFQRQNVASAST